MTAEEQRKKDKAAQRLGRKGGKKRAEKMTKEQRSAHASMMVAAREAHRVLSPSERKERGLAAIKERRKAKPKGSE